MQQPDAIALIRKGLDPSHPQRWVDLGAGSGTFTQALRDILHKESQIIAVDKEAQRIPFEFIRADFAKDDLPLSDLDGILMANAFHYVKDKVALIHKMERYFKSTRRFLIVEYDTTRRNHWVPYPVPFVNVEQLMQSLGYKINKLGEYPSRFGGHMYSALAIAD